MLPNNLLSALFVLPFFFSNYFTTLDVNPAKHPQLYGVQNKESRVNALGRITANAQENATVSHDQKKGKQDFFVCDPPVMLSPTNITNSFVKLPWQAPNPAPAGGYEYELRTSGAVGSGSTGLFNIMGSSLGATSIGISGLYPNTNFTFYLRAKCTGGVNSSWASVSFRTLNCLTPSVSVTATPSTNSPVCAGKPAILKASGLAPGGQVANFNFTETVTFPTIQNPPANTFSVDLWVNPNETVTNIQPSLNPGASFGTQRFIIAPKLLTTGNAGSGLSIGTNGINVIVLSMNGYRCLLSYTGEITGWTHVTIVYENKTPILYVDGVMVATGLSGYIPNIYPSIGSEGFGYSGIVAIDNVRVWNTALFSQDITAVACSETIETYNGKSCVAHYKFNGDYGSSIAGADSWNAASSNPNADYYTYKWMGTDAPTASTSETQTSFPLSANATYTVTATGGCLNPLTSAGVTVQVNPLILSMNETVTTSYNQSGIVDVLANCKLLATVKSFGPQGISGNITVSVAAGNPGTTSEGDPFVGRVVDITPDINPSASTADIVLYYSQADFDAFNSALTPAQITAGFSVLPVNANDPAKNLIRITEIHGSDPSNSSNTELIIPTTVNYNATKAWWEVSFRVTAFSRFYLSTNVNRVLPLSWLLFSGKLNAEGKALLNWQVLEQDVNFYTIQMSRDSRNFSSIGKLPSKGNGTNYYNFEDDKTVAGLGYYRIMQTDKDGKYDYSMVIKLNNSRISTGLLVSPNPTSASVKVTVGPRLINTQAALFTLAGNLLQRFSIRNNVFTINLDTFAAGIYLLKTEDGKMTKIVKE